VDIPQIRLPIVLLECEYLESYSLDDK